MVFPPSPKQLCGPRALLVELPAPTENSRGNLPDQRVRRELCRTLMPERGRLELLSTMRVSISFPVVVISTDVTMPSCRMGGIFFASFGSLRSWWDWEKKRDVIKSPRICERKSCRSAQEGERGPGLPVYRGSDNRSLEYDASGPDYVRFLLEELLPEALAGYRISPDPARRAIAGISSGGHCALNVAWERPDAFGKVLTHCGSFVGIRGGRGVSGGRWRNPCACSCKAANTISTSCMGTGCWPTARWRRRWPIGDMSTAWWSGKGDIR